LLRLFPAKPQRAGVFSILNYFNYFTEIEDTFVRRRAKHLMLSSMDWALIESWKEMGVPLHIALRGIEKAFDSWESKPRKRSVKTLLYCQEEVEAQYAEWLESRVGAEVEGEPDEPETISPDKVPFNRAAILEHLRHARTQIAALIETRNDSIDLVEALRRAVTQLSDLEREVEQSRQPEAQKLEVSLTGIERMLSDALQQSAPQEQQAELSAEIKKQLKPYRGHMEASVYEQTVNNLFLNRLREQLGIPRLSLFYLGL
jgi:ribosome maturation factor RimP